MGWITECITIYDKLADKAGENINGVTLLPIYHSTQNAQIEITIDINGNFCSSAIIPDDDAVTIIPVTEDSATRSSGVAPHPLFDKLIYVAGDYCSYIKNCKKNSKKYFEDYISCLHNWVKSDYTDRCIAAVYDYLCKGTIIRDLVNKKCLVVDSDGFLDEKIIISKKGSIKQPDAFVRFIVRDGETDIRLWESKELHNKFIMYYDSMSCEYDICYATGECVPITYKHASKIRNAGDKAKLVSSNDEANFTYRGRFKTKEEAYSLGRLASQKAHLALRWLSESAGHSVGTARYLAWENNLNKIPDVLEEPTYTGTDPLDDDTSADPKEEFDNLVKDITQYHTIVNNVIRGYERSLSFNSRVILMALDAATTGRLAVTMYQELQTSLFLENVKKWYSAVCWNYFSFSKDKETGKTVRVDSVKTPLPKVITKYAYGSEKNQNMEIDSKLCTSVIKQLYPCITMGRPIPTNILKSIFVRAANPQFFSKYSNWERTVEICCALHRKHYIDNEGVEYNMELDTKCDNRSYLYGRLVAVADKIESDVLAKAGEKRATNAIRYMNSVVNSPFSSWGYLQKQIMSYVKKMNPGFYVRYDKELGSIYSLFKKGDYEDKRPLDAMFFMGYYSEKRHLFTSTSKNEKANQENEIVEEIADAKEEK